ncbi:MAG: murein transglycosylase A [Campylobacterota bacterium]|nr:murein transglycosylase A [Campylobacterota bacterium]
MKQIYIIFILVIFILGCSKEPSVAFKELPQTNLQKSSFKDLPNWENENYDEVLYSFMNNCRAKKSVEIYGELCSKTQRVSDAKEFLESNFSPYRIVAQSTHEESIMTGYFEPELHGSLTKTQRFKYPIYNTPNDLVVVNLASVYADLKEYRLRGRLEENRVVPYYSRAEINAREINAEPICYCDSKIDKFFLEVQGSGRVKLDSGETIYVGYDNQNGHKYSSIGKYLVKSGEISQEDISLQSIRAWFKANPARVDEVLNHNASFVFFKQRKNAASGSLGLELTPLRSVAVDRRYIPLGSMVYLSALGKTKEYQRTVFAQDTGGAIKGSVRADMFLGFGDEAGEIAGELKAPLKLWILVPKKDTESKI